MGLTDDLRAQVLEATIRRAPATLDFHGRIQSEGFAPVQERLTSFRTNADPLHAFEGDSGGFQVRTNDAQAFLDVLEQHPVFSGDSRLDVGYPVRSARTVIDLKVFAKTPRSSCCSAGLH